MLTAAMTSAAFNPLATKAGEWPGATAGALWPKLTIRQWQVWVVEKAIHR